MKQLLMALLVIVIGLTAISPTTSYAASQADVTKMLALLQNAPAENFEKAVSHPNLSFQRIYTFEGKLYVFDFLGESGLVFWIMPLQTTKSLILGDSIADGRIDTGKQKLDGVWEKFNRAEKTGLQQETYFQSQYDDAIKKTIRFLTL